jgi:hypothetical protein
MTHSRRSIRDRSSQSQRHCDRHEGGPDTECVDEPGARGGRPTFGDGLSKPETRAGAHARAIDHESFSAIGRDDGGCMACSKTSFVASTHPVSPGDVQAAGVSIS